MPTACGRTITSPGPGLARRRQVGELHHAPRACDRRPHTPCDISSCPPSTGTTAPVMKLDAGEASSSATPLSSSGSAMRPIATMSFQASGGIGARVAADVRAKRPGRDRVHVHTVLGQLEGGLAHEHDHRRLGGRVRVADQRVGPDARGRGGHDDPPAALLLHVAGGLAHREQHAVQVDAEHGVPGVPIEVLEAAALVDHARLQARSRRWRRPRPPRPAPRRRRRTAADGGGIRDVQPGGPDVAAEPPGDRLEPIRVEVRQRDPCARLPPSPRPSRARGRSPRP